MVEAALAIRPARPDEAGLVLAFIRELAEYERLAHAVVATETDVQAMLFGPSPKAFCEIAERDGGAIGFALWFYTASTFAGRHGIHLEDIFVQPKARGLGVGKALMAALARRCAQENLASLEWAVLDWNAPAIAFYDSLGADTPSEWITRRLSGEALARLAER